MKNHSDIVIIGGGIIGLTTAYYLAREGFSVAVVDKGEFGREASWAGAGILPPGNPKAAKTPFDLLRAHSSAAFPSFSAELRERTGIDNGYRRSGGLEFVGGAHPAAEQEWRGEGIAFELLDEATLKELEPALSPELTRAYHLPDMAQLRNPRHVQALVNACQSMGVNLHRGCPTFGFHRQGNKILATRGDREFSADRFLLATGAWTESLLSPFGWQPGIKPIRGQIALLNTGTALLRKILLWGSQYIVPRPDGRVLAGSTEEDAGFAKQTTGSGIANLLNLSSRLVPGLGEAYLEHSWAGLRPGSPDGLPILGPVPGIENLFLAAGHFRAGIQLSLGTAMIMRELLMAQPLTIPLEPFSLERFERAY